MTIDQIFECMGGRKTIWTKRGDQVSKRSVNAASLSPRRKISTVKEGKHGA